MEHAEFLEQLLKTPQIYGARVSPDTKWVAWFWSNLEARAQVYVAPTDGSRPPLKLTNLDQDVYVRAWAHDSASLIVAHDTDGDERVRLYRVRISEPFTLEPLTEANPDFYISGGVLDPKGECLVYAANYDFAEQKALEESVVYRHELATGIRTPLARTKEPGHVFPRINSTGTHVLYSRNDLNPSGHQVWLVGIDGSNDREILNFGPAHQVEASWMPDGLHVLFVADTDAGYRKAGIWSLETGTIRWLVDNPERNIEAVHPVLGSNQVALLEVRNAETHAFLFELETGVETPWEGPHTSIPLARTETGMWVALHFNARQPMDIIACLPDSATPEKSIAGVWGKVGYTQDALAPAKSFWWKGTDGTPIQGWLYQPKGTPRGTILLVHGGPTGHSEDKFDLDVQALVSHGFIVLDPNYRGSTGFGLLFRESIKKEGWGGIEQDDIAEGARALISAGIAEAGKVGITGTSYGGYSSWCAITRYPKELIAAAAPICGMTDLVVDYYSTRPDLRPYSESMLGGKPDTAMERYRERSPIHFVKNIEGKLLVVQGGRDPNVTPQNVHAVEVELQKHAIPYEVLMFEDEGHGIARPHNQKTLLLKLAEFFEGAFSS